MNGKGDRPRPLSVSKEEFAANWDRIFKRKKKGRTKPASQDYVKINEGDSASPRR